MDGCIVGSSNVSSLNLGNKELNLKKILLDLEQVGQFRQTNEPMYGSAAK